MFCKSTLLFFSFVALFYESELAKTCPNETFLKKHWCDGAASPEAASVCASASNKFRKRYDLSQSGDLTLFFGGTFTYSGTIGCASHNIPTFCCRRVPNQPWICKRETGDRSAFHSAINGHLDLYRDCNHLFNNRRG